MNKKSMILMGVCTVVLLVIVSCSYLLDNDERPEDVEDMTGTWNLVSRESLDQDQIFSKAVDPKYDIEIEDTDTAIFTAKSQGVEFCGVRVGNSIVFEYRYGDTTWIRADGDLEGNAMVMYETHYYNEEHWFVCVSVYVLNGSHGYNVSIPSLKGTWDLKDGTSHMYDLSSDTEKSYSLGGKRFYISNQRGPLFRAEMQQTMLNEDGDETIVTRLMNGVFVGSSDGRYVAFLLDESGKMWTLFMQKDLAVLRAIVISENDDPMFNDRMVITERTYYSEIPSHVPDAPDVTGTWTTDGAYGIYGDGADASRTMSVEMALTSNGNVFTGYSVSGTTVLAEGGYMVYDPEAISSDHLIRMGTDIGDGTFTESYVILTDNEETLTLVEFVYESGKNGVIYFEFEKS